MINICDGCDLKNLCWNKRQNSFYCPNYDPKEDPNYLLFDNSVISGVFKIWYDFIDADGNESNNISVVDARMFKLEIKRNCDEKPIIVNKGFLDIKPNIKQNNNYIFIDENNMLRIDYNFVYDDLPKELGIINPNDVKFKSWLNKINESLNDMIKILEEEEFCYYIDAHYTYPNINHIYIDE